MAGASSRPTSSAAGVLIHPEGTPQLSIIKIFPPQNLRREYFYLTYSITTRRLGSVPVEWVVMFSISCRVAWITWRS